MNQERLTSVLVAPYVTEKAAMAADAAHQHVFKVLPSATKLEIKKAVEALFDVKVAAVRTVRMSGKSKRFGQMQGKRNDWKKAYVTLAEGYNIDFTGEA
ncbi:MAG: 50S ribosomal protein L23 [Gammaproteobacteria bacterium]|jgi:large subunit ribosomal protein L23